MAKDVETKLAAARTRLILEKPFLGALTLRLPLVAADPKWCRTTATDARTFYYNREYIEALSTAEAQFVVAHEALHCALLHFARRQHRIKQRWDVACDFAINPLLIDDGLTAPPGSLYLPEFAGMTAEEIYPMLDETNEEEPLDQHLYDATPPQDPAREPGDESNQNDGTHGELDPNAGGAPQPPPLSPQEQETLGIQWQQRLAGAAQQALQAGKLSGAMARMVDHLLQPQLPWRMLLARYMTAIARDDYSYMRPSRREGAAILPSLRSNQAEIVIVIDTSGSISAEEMALFLAEVNAIKGQLRARIILHACDAELAPNGPWQCEAWEELTVPPKLSGGGGTSFKPPFAWVERQDRAPDLLLYFTDGAGEFPATPPSYPVLWLIKGKTKVPWGQRIQLN